MTSTERDLRLTIATLRRVTGESQRDLAKALGIHQDQVSRKEAGTRPWSVKELHHIADHYEMSPADLFRGVDHAVRHLPERRRADAVAGTQTTITTTTSPKSGTRR